MPKWLGLIDLTKDKTDDSRVLHIPITSVPALEDIAPRQYGIDHFDFTDTIDGDERTIRFKKQPRIEVKDNTVRYVGDIFLAEDKIQMIVDWDTIDFVCRTASFKDLELQMGAPGEQQRTIRDPCDSVNL